MTPRLDGVRVMLADDHAMVRLGQRFLLEGARATVVAEVGTGEDALAGYAQVQPDVLVMDVSMPGIGGLGALERLLAREPKARVIMLSVFSDDYVPGQALKLGARGYLCKQSEPEAFLSAVEQVAQGGRYLDPALAASLALASLSGTMDPCTSLTDKEFQVFLKLAGGVSVREAAREFCLSESTIGTHLYHIKQKLNVRNASELTLLALHCGMLDLAHPVGRFTRSGEC
jgi:two-component system invasion response regulator UvrY